MHRKMAVAAPLLVALLLAIIFAANIGLSDLQITRAKTELSFWGRQNYRPHSARVSLVEENVSAALANWPGNPDYLETEARLLLWQAYWDEDQALIESLSRRAFDLKLNALRRRPAHRQSWVELAVAKARFSQNDRTFKWATEKITKLNPH